MKVKRANPKKLKQGDTVWIKATVDEVFEDSIDISVADTSGHTEWNYDIPMEKVFVEKVKKVEAKK